MRWLYKTQPRPKSPRRIAAHSRSSPGRRPTYLWRGLGGGWNLTRPLRLRFAGTKAPSVDGGRKPTHLHSEGRVGTAAEGSEVAGQRSTACHGFSQNGNGLAARCCISAGAFALDHGPQKSHDSRRLAGVLTIRALSSTPGPIIAMSDVMNSVGKTATGQGARFNYRHEEAKRRQLPCSNQF